MSDFFLTCGFIIKPVPNSEKDVRLKLNLNFYFLVLIVRSSGSRKKESKG